VGAVGFQGRGAGEPGTFPFLRHHSARMHRYRIFCKVFLTDISHGIVGDQHPLEEQAVRGAYGLCSCGVGPMSLPL
jgi:hypothetical protein